MYEPLAQMEHNAYTERIIPDLVNGKVVVDQRPHMLFRVFCTTVKRGESCDIASIWYR